MPNLSRYSQLMGLLSEGQRTSLAGVQHTLSVDPLYLEHVKEHINEERLQRLSGIEVGHSEVPCSCDK